MGPFQNHASRLPRYYQIKRYLLDQIEQGLYPAATPLPSEVALARQFGVARMTIRQAVGELVTEGVLLRQHGKPPRVAPEKEDVSFISLDGFMKVFAGRDLDVEVVRHQVMALRKAPAQVQEEMALPGSSSILCVVRRRLTEGESIGVETSYLHLALCPGIEKVDLRHESLYAHLHDDFGIRPAIRRGVFEVAVAGPQIAEDLGVREGIPVLIVRGVTRTSRGEVLQWCEEIYRGDRYRFKFELASGSGGLRRG